MYMCIVDSIKPLFRYVHTYTVHVHCGIKHALILCTNSILLVIHMYTIKLFNCFILFCCCSRSSCDSYCLHPLPQCMASILDPNTFLYALVYKFRLEKWLSGPLSAVGKRGEQKDDQLKFLINELEEFLFLLIIIFCKLLVIHSFRQGQTS